MIKFFKRIMNKLFSRTQKYFYCSNCKKKVLYKKTCPFCNTKTIEIIERSDYFEIRDSSGHKFMIEKNPSDEMFTWEAAINHAQNLKTGGYSKGWRLPTVEELRIIYKIKDLCELPNDGWLWSYENSTGNQHEAQCLSLADGKIYDDKKSDSRIYVCCVRKKNFFKREKL